MGIARSTFYDRPDAGADDATVVAQMKTICDEFETYGYRRVGAELRHRGLVVNAKKVRRLMRMQALNPKQRRRFVMTTDSDATRYEVRSTAPESCGQHAWRWMVLQPTLGGPISPMSPSRPASCTWLSFSMPGPVGS